MNEQSFMKSLFHGVIAESVVFPYPEPSQTEGDAIHGMLDSVRKFCAANVDSARIDREHVIPPEVIEGMKQLGLFGMLIPQAYGGAGTSTTTYARVIQEIAGRCKEVESGARNVDHILTGTLLPEMSGEFLSRMSTGQPVTSVKVGVADGKFTYVIA